MSIATEIYWLALTIWMEAQGEPFLGKLAVGHVIMTRKGLGSLIDTVLRKMQFSCWNSDSTVRMRVDIAEDDPMWEDSYKAASAAYFDLLPDPTKGANHYLNLDSVQKVPSWYDPQFVTIKIGEHSFLKIG